MTRYINLERHKMATFTLHIFVQTKFTAFLRLPA